jgi:hypothetical protein
VAGSGGITGPSGIGPSAAVNGRITVGNAGRGRGIIGLTGVANGATRTGLAINCARIAINQGFHPDSFTPGHGLDGKRGGGRGCPPLVSLAHKFWNVPIYFMISALCD